MSDTRSRSEIESALSGTQKLHKRKVSLQNEKDKLTDFELETRSRRRQQVIGGDLTGVSRKRSKNSLLNKFSEINITNWLAAIVVFAILVAFFWPHNNTESIREIAERNTDTKTESFYTESRIDELQEVEPTANSFGRDSDVDRAEQYRVQEQTQQQIEELLINAKQNIAKGQYITPNDSNALNNYRAVLAIDQNNSEAQAGIKQLKTRLLENGQLALQDNDESKTISILKSMDVIETNSEEHQQLTSNLEQWRQDIEITDLLAKANKAKDEDNLILPADESSLYFYRQVLAIDTNNSAAKLGIKNITDIYIDRANKALLSGDLEQATGYLASASVIDVDHPSIEIVRGMIATAEPIAAQTEINRQQNSRDSTSNESSSQRPLEGGIAKTEENSETTNQDSLDPPSLALVQTNPNRQISDIKTPQQQANEQAEFDQIYLTQGLDAYYRGEYDKAVALLKPLADKGVSRAQFRIGYMHYLGRGVPKNTTEADRILRAALPAIQKFANEGRSWAQSDLGSLYEDGLVLPRNYSEAIFWYRSAAVQGYPGAQTNLGIMYARGRGVTTSRQTAIEWFQRAAKQGDIAAQRNLASLGVN